MLKEIHGNKLYVRKQKIYVQGVQIIHLQIQMAVSGRKPLFNQKFKVFLSNLTQIFVNNFAKK